MDKVQEKDGQIQVEKEEEEIVKNFESDKFSFSPKIIAVLAGLIVLGALGGYVVANYGGASPKGTVSNQITSPTQIEKGTVFGSDDTKTFKDTTEGVVKKGGIDGEGQYHLVRPGGESQNVYMTSSVVDLSLVLEKKVKVWGETQAAQKAGWLMDVGRVEVQ